MFGKRRSVCKTTEPEAVMAAPGPSYRVKEAIVTVTLPDGYGPQINLPFDFYGRDKDRNRYITGSRDELLVLIAELEKAVSGIESHYDTISRYYPPRSRCCGSC